ncbi:hypothetical protein GUJ93_ZPchr0008g13040 [Zizania palustris]|uniref:Uncharacterized protein n=1 Tax=Zizania palustris TaxID=103762 RepID=A0A8J5V1L0_ZIZPA|nr:hypothetical protein GUJ93_ZPchr0008g13040 [Zizania palustris]
MTEKELLAELSDNLGDRITELFDVLPELSPSGREMLTGLLAFDPKKRLTAVEEPWNTGGSPRRRRKKSSASRFIRRLGLSY